MDEAMKTDDITQPKTVVLIYDTQLQFGTRPVPFLGGTGKNANEAFCCYMDFFLADWWAISL